MRTVFIVGILLAFTLSTNVFSYNPDKERMYRLYEMNGGKPENFDKYYKSVLEWRHRSYEAQIAHAIGGVMKHCKPVLRIGQIAELPQKPEMIKKLVCFRIQTGGCYNYVFQEQPAFTPFLNDRILEAQFFLSQKSGGERINCPISLDPIIWIQADSNDDRKLSDL